MRKPSGVWAPSFLLTILVLTFFFAILYSASTLFGVLTRSPIAAILLTCAVWFLLFITGILHLVFETARGMDYFVMALMVAAARADFTMLPMTKG